MGALMFLVVTLILGVLAAGALVVVPLVNGARAKELRSAKAQVKVLTRTMRVIANGTSGNPALEAQIALDDSEGIYVKELN